MEILNVVVAAATAWMFGALWYGLLGERWREAQGLTEDEVRSRGALPFVVSFVLILLVAGMVRHVLGSAGIATSGAALVSGLGLGAFVAAPWVLMNVIYSGKSAALLWMDGLYPVFGCAIIAWVLVLF